MNIEEIVKWLTGHTDEIMAIIGAGYVLARMIVALTPTDTDDKALEKANLTLKAIVVAFGLDIKQGINKP